MSVLVTGASGFVGTVLCRALVHEGVHVRALVRREGAAVVHALVTEVVRPDIAAIEDWDVVIGDAESVIHCAAAVHRTLKGQDVDVYRRVNTEATAALAEAFAGRRTEGRFVFLSSVKAAVEGEGLFGEQVDGVLAPEPYAQTKRDAEDRLKEIGQATGTPWVIVRSPLVYGPGVRANFATLLRYADRVGFWPFGRQTNRRSMVYVENLAAWLVRALESPDVVGGTWSVADGSPMSTAAVLAEARRALGRKPSMLPLSGEMTAAALRRLGRTGIADRLFGSLWFDAEPAWRAVGAQAPWTMAEGMRATVEWYRDGGLHRVGNPG